MKVKELVKWLKKNGWKLSRIQGSHRVFVHPDGNRSIPVPIHSKDIDDILAKTIMKQAKQALLED